MAGRSSTPERGMRGSEGGRGGSAGVGGEVPTCRYDNQQHYHQRQNKCEPKYYKNDFIDKNT